jgi:hypothetical protein
VTRGWKKIIACHLNLRSPSNEEPAIHPHNKPKPVKVSKISSSMSIQHGHVTLSNDGNLKKKLPGCEE